MPNYLLYLITVAIWGSTWLAIKYQLGVVDPMVSVGYRFLFASILLLIYCGVRRLPMRFTAREHLGMALQGLLLFALNYWLFYVAELTLTSGIVALVFSTMVVWNMLNGAWFLGSPLEGRVVAGAAFGLCGIVLVFWPEVSAFNVGDSGLTGLGLCLGATLLASLGNIVSASNQRRGLPVVQTNAYGMGYGAAAMLLLSAARGSTFGFELTLPYVGSMLYLAIFGSIVAFGCYLTLLGRIGAGRAAYATLIFPLVALGLSTIFEGYTWSVSALLGVGLILAGNILALTNFGSARSPAVKRPSVTVDTP
jgi:drug/metabolite transporter (DMT)-like permease